MKKIVVVTTSLSCGGITSFLIPLINMLADEEYDVTLAYTRDDGNFLSRIRGNVRRLQFKALTKRQTIIAGVKNFAFYDMARIFLRKDKQVPRYSSVQRLAYITAKYTSVTDDTFDIAISTAEGFCNALVANRLDARKKIGWVHPDMATLGLDINAGKRIIDKLDRLVAVSEPGCNTLKKLFPKDSYKIIHIENMMDNEDVTKRSKEIVTDMPRPDGFKIIVTVCRVTNDSKRLDRMVKIGKILSNNGVKYFWYIIGDGPDANIIKDLIRENGLDSYIKMLGGRTNPLPYIKAADYFVLTSQFEGKPVVVEEAKILHVPVLVTNYSSAKQQVTENFGKVFPNEDGVLEALMATFIQQNDISIYKGKNREYRYDNSLIINRIKDLIEK